MVEITGTGGDDTIFGSAEGDVLIGLEGQDSLAGSDGDDSLDGGEGDDSLGGGDGRDTLSGGQGADRMSGGDGDDLLESVDGFGVADVLDGGAGVDTAVIDRSGYLADLTISIANPGAEAVAQDGTCLIGIERLAWYGGAGTDAVIGGALDDIILGRGGNDSLTGGDGNDELDGGTGTNLLSGGIGDDVLVSGSGAVNDSLDGGDGTDRLVLYRGSTAVGLTVNIANPLAVVTAQDGTRITGIEQLLFFGGSGTDDVTGAALSDTLDGGGGHDTLAGGEGHDRLDGGAGDDTLRGGGGDDRLASGETGAAAGLLDGGTGNDLAVIDRRLLNSAYVLALAVPGVTAVGSDGLAVLDVERLSFVGGGGDDSIAGGLLEDALAGGAGDDTLSGRDGDDSLWGGLGNDVLLGGGGDDVLLSAEGSAQADVLDGGAGIDTAVIDRSGSALGLSLTLADPDATVTGADGTSLTGIERLAYQGGSGTDSITGGALDDTLAGGGGCDLLAGGAGDDTLDGGQGNDSLSGGDGDDTLFATEGTGALDVLDGGAGTDLAIVWRQDAGLGLILSIDDPGLVSTAADGTSLTGIERLEFAGGWGDDSVTGGALADSLSGAAGNDHLAGGAGDDSLIGGGGSDTLAGGGGNDRIWTEGTGFDHIDGGTGHDMLFLTRAGEAGGLALSIAHPQMTLAGSDGTTVTGIEQLAFQGGSGADSITGGDHADTLNGGAGENSLNGGAGDDRLDGGSGNDNLIGGDGDDLLLSGGSLPQADLLDGGDGIDSAVVTRSGSTLAMSLTIAAPAAWSVAADGTGLTGIERLTYLGGSGSDRITGGSLADHLSGNGGADTLEGGGGSDRLFGGNGVDRLFGGAGDDLLDGGAGNDTLNAGGGADTLCGGDGWDTALLTGSAADYVQSSADGTTRLTRIATGEVTTLIGIEAIRFAVNLPPLNAPVVLVDLAEDTSRLITAAELLANADDPEGAPLTVLNLAPMAGQVVQVAGGWIFTPASNDNTAVTFSYLVSDGTGSVAGTAVLDLQPVNDLPVGSVTVTGNPVEGATLTAVTSALADADGLGALGFQWLRDGVALSGATGATLVLGEAASGGAISVRVGWTDGGGTAETVTSGTSAPVALGVSIQRAVSFSLPDNGVTRNLTLTGTAVQATGNTLDNLLTGNAFANTLNGLGGNDTLVGGAGGDVYVGDGNDRIIENAAGGIDILRSSANATLAPWVEVLVLTGAAVRGTGNTGDNRIFGNALGNTLNGGTGLDTLVGGAGDDLYLSDGDDTLVEGDGGGRDTLRSSANVTLAAWIEVLVLTGAAVNGTGNALDNHITGTAGHNTLNGGAGADTLIGGAGDDVYIVDFGDTVVERAGGGYDTVRAVADWVI